MCVGVGWALASSALVGSFVSDVSVPVSFPAPRMFPLPLFMPYIDSDSR